MIFDSLMQFLYNFLIYSGYTILIIAAILIVGWPIFKRRLFPIPFIVIKNAGGAKNSNTVTLSKKIIHWGRIVQTDYGSRVKVLGIKNTLPMGVLSKDNAFPWDNGGVAWIIYEKEIGQYFPVDSNIKDLDLVIPKKKESSEKIKKLYERLVSKYPDLADSIHLTRVQRAAVPLSFSNHEVKLQPFPIEASTQYMVDYKLRLERTMRKGWWDKYGQMVVSLAIIGLVIVTIVLTYDWTGERLDAQAARIMEESKSFGERIASELSGEKPPGGNPESNAGVILPLIPILRRSKKRGGFRE